MNNDNNQTATEDVVVSLAQALFDDNENNWEHWKTILQDEKYKSEMNSLFFDVLRYIVYLDVDIGDVWFKYNTTVRPKLEKAGLIEADVLDDADERLKAVLYASKAKHDLLSKVMYAIGFKNYANKRLENNPNKDKVIAQLTATIAGKKYAEYIESKIEDCFKAETDSFIQNDLVNFKSELQNINAKTEDEITSEATIKTNELKENLKLTLQKAKINLRRKIEDELINTDLISEDYGVINGFSSAFEQKTEITLQLLAMVIDSLVETEVKALKEKIN